MMMNLWQEECMTINKLNMEFWFTNCHTNVTHPNILEKTKVKRFVAKKKKKTDLSQKAEKKLDR